MNSQINTYAGGTPVWDNVGGMSTDDIEVYSIVIPKDSTLLGHSKCCLKS